MKREWDLIRAIMLAVEDLPTLGSTVRPDDITGWNNEMVSYHIFILIEAGLLVGECHGGKWQKNCFAQLLTWQGQEFLSMTRDKSTFNKIAALLKEKAIDLSYDAIKQGFLQLIM
jgi:hypothetical protein